MKKNQKLLYAGLLFFTLLNVCFFCLAVNTAHAVELEVKYPPVTFAGQTSTLTASSGLPEFALYLFNAGMFLGFFSAFLSLIIAGVMYFLSPIKPDFISMAKDRIGGAVSGILILILTYLIVTTINPALSIFYSEKLPAVATQTQEEKKPTGVYLYGKPECSDVKIQAQTSSISDLGDLKNNILAAEIVHSENAGYVAILYENPGFWGKCQYTVESKCFPLRDMSISSVSIHTYDFDPSGEGVIFYRKSFFDKKGGFIKIDNSEISNPKNDGTSDDDNTIYTHNLNNLNFENVPEEEQDCVKYDKKGECTERQAPTLAGENISSIEIDGNYAVILSYAGPGQDCESVVNDACQEFPSPGDVNKIGPQQIKWQSIRNSGGHIPNCVTIIPIQ